MDHHDPIADIEPPAAHPPRSPTEELLHRWLVEYNPFYLLSAALVLAGIWLISREAARVANLSGALAVGALAEVYALSLIAGAAFLTRIGQRRSAVMLGLIAVFYQGDLTLHVETCTFLGTAGVVASTTWFALFVAKLAGLALALQLRPSVSASAVPLLGAVGLAFIPHVLRELAPGARAVLVCGWTFAVLAGALWTDRKVISRAGWDDRGRRAMHATWAIWGALLLCHVLYWAPTYRVSLVLLLPAGLLLAVPFMRHEAHVHGLAACALALGCLMAPQHFWVTALMTAVTLAVGAGRSLLVKAAPPAVQEAPHPYRNVPIVDHVPAPTRFVADERARPRLLLGALASLYLAVWTPDAGQALTAVHAVGPLLAVSALVITLALRTRQPALTASLLPLVFHALAQRKLMPPLPETALAWGVAFTGTGFAVLFGALGASWYVGRRQLARVAPNTSDQTP